MKVLLDQFLVHHSPPSPRKRDELHQWLSAAETLLTQPTHENSHGERININMIYSRLYPSNLLAIEITNEDWSSLVNSSSQDIIQSGSLSFTPDYGDRMTVSTLKTDWKRH